MQSFELLKKAFTQKTTVARVQKLYADAFSERIRDAKNLMFAGVQWAPEEIYGFGFAQVIEVNKMVQRLDLSANNVGEGGRVIEQHPTLQSLDLAA